MWSQKSGLMVLKRRNRSLSFSSSCVIPLYKRIREEEDRLVKMATSVLLKLGVLVLCVVTGLEAAEKESRDPMAKAFHTLKQEEKVHFLSYFLALGLKDWAEAQPRYPKFFGPESVFINSLNIPQESVEKFEKMNIPKESRKKLLNWTKTEFNLSTKNVVELIKSKKCAAATCLPDIGELCCPW